MGRGLSGRFLATVYVPAVVILAATAIGSIYTQIPIDQLTKDPTTVGHLHPLTGVVSNLGILLWCASATLCLLGGALARRTGPKETSRFLLLSGLLTLVLLLDDLFRFHETFAPEYLGLSQPSVIAAYGLLTATYLLDFRRVILRTEWALLLVALVCFAISVGLDQSERWLWCMGHWETFVEDGFKFLGLVSWCGYFAQVTWQFVVTSAGVRPEKTLPPPAEAEKR